METPNTIYTAEFLIKVESQSEHTLPTPVERIAEETLLETKYQTFLLEMMI